MLINDIVVHLKSCHLSLPRGHSKSMKNPIQINMQVVCFYVVWTWNNTFFQTYLQEVHSEGTPTSNCLFVCLSGIQYTVGVNISTDRSCVGNFQTKIYPRTFHKHTFWYTPYPPPPSLEFKKRPLLWVYAHNGEISPQFGSVLITTPTMYRL